MPGKNSFQLKWCNMSDFHSWLLPATDKYMAHCSVCTKDFKIDNAGVANIRSHAKGKSHINAIKMQQSQRQPTIQAMMCEKSSWESKSSTSSIAANSTTAASAIATSTISSSAGAVSTTVSKESQPLIYIHNKLLRDSIVKAEILQCLKVVDTHVSVRSADLNGDIYREMFPDSEIARGYKMSKDKIGYMLTYGLGEYYSEKATDTVLSADQFVVMFDESLNKVSAKCQMDLHVRYINDKNMVETKYIYSAFLGHPTAANLLTGLQDCLPKSCSLSKILQLSMDGPSVNWKVFRLLQNELSETSYQLLDIGSCGIHTIHNAFKMAFKKSNWQLDVFLRSCYYLFKDSPARRADYTRVTGSSTFPMKFVGVRWLENQCVAKRILVLMPHLHAYVNAVKSKQIVTTISRSMATVIAELNNVPLLRAKLEFFCLLAGELEPFLREFQTNVPMAPFLYEQLQAIIRKQLSRFVKKELLASAKTGSKLMEIDIEKVSNLMQVHDIDIGFGPKRALHGSSEARADRGVVMAFRNDSQNILKHLVMKIKEKSPLKYSLTRGISSLDPSVIASNREVCKKRFKVMCEKLIDAGRLTASRADAINSLWSDLTATSSFVDRATNFSRYIPEGDPNNNQEHRLDQFYFNVLGSKPQYAELYKVIKIILMLSHGNAEVERGFSVNKHLLHDNITEKSLIAQRLVHQAIRQEKSILNIKIDNKMLAAVKLASQRRKQHLQDCAKESAEEQARRIRAKRNHLDIQELKAKRQKLVAEKEVAISLIDEELSQIMNKTI